MGWGYTICLIWWWGRYFLGSIFTKYYIIIDRELIVLEMRLRFGTSKIGVVGLVGEVGEEVLVNPPVFVLVFRGEADLHPGIAVVVFLHTENVDFFGGFEAEGDGVKLAGASVGVDRG